MSRANGKAPPDALEELDEVIAELEGEDWSEISEVTANHIHLPPGTTLEADRTGRLRAVSAPDIEETRPENPRPDSQPPKARFALRVLEMIQPPWLRAVVVLVAIGAAVYLVGRGVRLWP